MKQSVTLTGLGSSQFLSAVQGVATVYQHFKTHISRKGGSLREWAPGLDGKDAVLTFFNRYLTKAKEAGDEPQLDLGTTIDPFNILRPLLQNEVHVQENVVEYWEKSERSVSPIGLDLPHCSCVYT